MDRASVQEAAFEDEDEVDELDEEPESLDDVEPFEVLDPDVSALSDDDEDEDDDELSPSELFDELLDDEDDVELLLEPRESLR